MSILNMWLSSKLTHYRISKQALKAGQQGLILKYFSFENGIIFYILITPVITLIKVPSYLGVL